MTMTKTTSAQGSARTLLAVFSYMPAFQPLAVLALVITLLSITGCSEDSKKDVSQASTPTATVEGSPDSSVPSLLPKAAPSAKNLAVLQHIQDILEQSVKSTQALADNTQAFVGAPSAELHTRLLDSYTNAHQDYRLAFASAHVSEQALFSAFQIDDQPLLKGYLDSVDGYPHSGLINSELPIDLATLESEYQFSDPMYLTLGFQPYAFILSGDPSHPVAAWRRFADEGTEKQKNTAQRRRSYLSLLANQIHKKVTEQHDFVQSLEAVDLGRLEDQEFWQNYTNEEQSLSGNESAEKIKALITTLRGLHKA